MFALHFVQAVADSVQEVVVRAQDGTVQIELDYGLRLADRGELTCVVCALELLLGDIGCVLHDLAGLAIEVEDRVVRSLYPKLPAAARNALVLTSIELPVT